MSREVRLEERLPVGRMLRRIDEVPDLGFVQEAMAPHHARGGRPSIDPEPLMRMLSEPLTKPPDRVEADRGAGERGEGPVDVGVALVADRQPPKAGEPGGRALDHPAVSPEAVRALDAAARDAGCDGPLAAFGPAAAVVVGLVGVELAARANA